MAINFIDIITNGITTSIAIIVGTFFFTKVRGGGIKVPILYGNQFVNKVVASVAFLASIYVVEFFSGSVKPQIKNFLAQNQTNLVLGIIAPLVVFWLLFDYLFFKRSSG